MTKEWKGTSVAFALHAPDFPSPFPEGTFVCHS